MYEYTYISRHMLYVYKYMTSYLYIYGYIICLYINTNILVSDMMDITSQLSYRMKVGTSCIYLRMCILNRDGLKIRKPKKN
jgi:hypothetical protein